MTPTSPHVVHESDRPEERWGDIVVWRTLISADVGPSSAITMGSAEIQPGAPTDGACHRHVEPEVYFVLTGTGVVHIDGVEHPVTAGSAVFIPGHAWHFAANTGSEPLRLIYAFAVDRFDEIVYERRGQP